MPVILRDSTLEFTMYLFCIFGQKCLDNALVSIDNLVMQKSRGCEALAKELVVLMLSKDYFMELFLYWLLLHSLDWLLLYVNACQILVIFNALGGILVGLVTSHAGGVRKGFVIVSALLVTAMMQFIFEGKPPFIVLSCGSPNRGL
ncbi:hypothetical protein CMV_020947 [Castanea mollissima]|uniref:Uncharacterized protein n=1 Tax=Castanea mollissima TaxID=60419 RepID=A0A8J4QZX9_9ROSI|nr:hypothetical protein CMV_020947 [Castanea mollissima]